jgi:ParB/RepB/Spo0J family partition protein
MNEEIIPIEISKILVQKYNVRRKDIAKGIEDLAESVRAHGLLQPITVFFDSEKDKYVILAGQRRLNAHHYLVKTYPKEKQWNSILCRVIDEPTTDEEKMSLSLAENITSVQMANSDLVKAVTDLWNVYGDYDLVKEKFGLTKYMVDKFVKMSRLPERLQEAIKEGEISNRPAVAENAALRAVDSLKWTKGGDVDIEDVVELAKEYAKGEIDSEALDKEARKGGSVKEIKESAKSRPRKKFTLDLDDDIATGLKKVSDLAGESEAFRAISYIADGVSKDLEDMSE